MMDLKAERLRETEKIAQINDALDLIIERKRNSQVRSSRRSDGNTSIQEERNHFADSIYEEDMMNETEISRKESAATETESLI